MFVSLLAPVVDLIGLEEQREQRAPVALAVMAVISSSAFWALWWALSTRERAARDSLTGLASPGRVDQHLSRAARNSRPGHHVAVLAVDVTNFGTVNDAAGIEAGDQVLVTLAHRIAAAVRPADLSGRLGADDFVVVCEGLSDADEAFVIAKRVLASLTTPIYVGDQDFTFDAAVGVALTDMGWPTGPDSLIVQAQSALRLAKLASPVKIVAFNPGLGDPGLEQREMLDALRKGIPRDEIVLRYQPEVDLRTGKLCSVEVLTRWAHPDKGLLYPGSFIELAEESGLVVEMGEYVIGEAAKQAALWQGAGPNGQPVSVWVNVSAHHLASGTLVDTVRTAVEGNGLVSGALGIEITESAFTSDLDGAAQQIRELVALGVSVAIDDFGTGHASLSYLSKLPAQQLKIDATFTSGLPNRHDDVVIVGSIIRLAEALGMTVVAEGVETMDQLRSLVEMRCARGQGFIWSKPVSPEEAERMFLLDWCGSPDSVAMSDIVRQQMDDEESRRIPPLGGAMPARVRDAVTRAAGVLSRATEGNLKDVARSCLAEVGEACDAKSMSVSMTVTEGGDPVVVRWDSQAEDNAPAPMSNTERLAADLGISVPVPPRDAVLVFPLGGSAGDRLAIDFKDSDDAALPWAMEALQQVAAAFATAASRQVAAGLRKENRRLRESAHLASAAMSAADEMARTVSAESISEAADKALGMAGRALGADWVGVYIPSGDAPEHVADVLKEWKFDASDIGGIGLDVSGFAAHLIDRVARSGKPFSTTVGDGAAAEDASVMGELAVVSVCAVPIGDASAPNGVMWAASKRRERWGEDEAALLGAVSGAVGAALSRERSERHFAAVAAWANEMVLLLDRNGTVSYASESVRHVLGLPPDRLVGRTVIELCSGDHDNSDAASVVGKVTESLGSRTDIAVRADHVDGSVRSLEGTCTNLLDSPHVNGVVVNLHDVTERQRLQAELEALALEDPLTGLPNRRLLEDRLGTAASRSHRSGKRVGVLYVDLDGFKSVNDDHGHPVGDGVLCEVAARLLHATRSTDTVCRVGGDEFVVICEEVSSVDDCQALVDRIVRQMQEPVTVEGAHRLISVSVGMTLMEDDDDLSSVVERADRAMFMAKSEGPNSAKHLPAE